MTPNITPRSDAIFVRSTTRPQDPSLIIIWDARRGARPRPEWLNSMLISNSPSEVRR
jgi:hypothetical protein